MSERMNLGISTCLLGESVRYDGGHKGDPYLTDVLGEWFDWVAVCPELDIGLGVPRPTIRLVRGEPLPRLVEPKSGDDLAEKMETYSQSKVDDLMAGGLDGYVLKRASPSCGMKRVKVFGAGGVPKKNGVGIFARVLLEKWPNLPVEEEGRLNDARLRENFIERIFAYRRLKDLFDGGARMSELVAFHTAHKLQLMSHSTSAYRSLGRLVGEASSMPSEQVEAVYRDGFMSALAEHATPGRHVNVIEHMVGYFSKQLDARGRRELVDLVSDYRSGFVPLVVPLTLIRHYVDHFEVEYLQGQYYLEPHPRELMLRNHV